VAGVYVNQIYQQRERPKTAKQWNISDFRFLPLEGLENKDPNDLKDEQIKLLSESMVWVTLKGVEGEVRVPSEKTRRLLLLQGAIASESPFD
jgi:hypothetical protein